MGKNANEFVHLANADNPVHAAMLCQFLESQEIPTLQKDAGFGNIPEITGTFLGGIRVFVPKDALPLAQELMQNFNDENQE